MRKIVALACIATLSGCATQGYFEPVAGEKQRIVYEDGKEVLYSRKGNLVAVALPATFESGERIRGYVQVGNGTLNSFDFSPNYIEVTAAVGTPMQEKLHVYTYEELVAEQKRKEMWQAVAIALAGAAQSYSAAYAGHSTTYGTYSGNANGNIYGMGSSYGNNYSFTSNYSGMYTAHTYDPYKAQLAQQQANANTQHQMQHLMENSQAAMYELSKNMLKRNTVDSGGICGGLIALDSPNVEQEATFMEIEVETGEEIHVFKYRVRKAE